MMTTARSFPENLPSGWKALLAEEKEKSYFKSLNNFLKSELKGSKPIFPSKDRILSALQSVDYNNVRVVILGQDPYHGYGQAIGLSFAVPNSLTPKPPSLVNIFKELESDLKTKINYNNSELSQWTKQGVLLLNTVLTVRASEAFSHRNQGWEFFTDRIITLLSMRSDPIIFILWGASARKKKELIECPPHFIIESAHPSPLSAHNGFFGSRPFSKANSILKKIGKDPIHWEASV